MTLTLVYSNNKENTDERGRGVARKYYGSPSYKGPVPQYVINRMFQGLKSIMQDLITEGTVRQKCGLRTHGSGSQQVLI